MQKEKLDITILKKLGLEVKKEPELGPWKDFLSKVKNPKSTVNVALVGKYIQLPDAYKSINESFIHAGAVNNTKVNVHMVNAEDLNSETSNDLLKDFKGILVAPGFGSRGIEGKIEAVKFARENDIPFLGICLGMQCAVIEFARNVIGMKKANSTEMDYNTKYPVIDLMESQKQITDMGGTMRLGLYPCTIIKDSNAYKAYKILNISERHRHRYEFNNRFIKDFEKHGMKATGFNPDTELVEIIEIPKLKWFVGVQFHPEYKSTVINPHPIFSEFIKATLS
jgi:CTP synthase